MFRRVIWDRNACLRVLDARWNRSDYTQVEHERTTSLLERVTERNMRYAQYLATLGWRRRRLWILLHRRIAQRQLAQHMAGLGAAVPCTDLAFPLAPVSAPAGIQQTDGVVVDVALPEGESDTPGAVGIISNVLNTATGRDMDPEPTSLYAACSFSPQSSQSSSPGQTFLIAEHVSPSSRSSTPSLASLTASDTDESELEDMDLLSVTYPGDQLHDSNPRRFLDLGGNRVTQHHVAIGHLVSVEPELTEQSLASAQVLEPSLMLTPQSGEVINPLAAGTETNNIVITRHSVGSVAPSIPPLSDRLPMPLIPSVVPAVVSPGLTVVPSFVLPAWPCVCAIDISATTSIPHMPSGLSVAGDRGPSGDWDGTGGSSSAATTSSSTSPVSTSSASTAAFVSSPIATPAVCQCSSIALLVTEAPTHLFAAVGRFI